MVEEIVIEPVYDNYLCMKGSFGGVSYYMTTFAIEKVADGLHFEKDLNIKNASFAERIQRTLNQKRAEEEIYQNYLLNEGTRFFNSLVVTIIPADEDRGFYKEEQIPNSSVYKLYLRQGVKKIVVDGQHRLFALRKLREDIISGAIDREDLKELQVPIIFILFDSIDSRIENLNPIKDQIIKETRRVFTALNKTAKKIDKYTTLILDDSDFSAIVSRKILEENVVDELYVKWAYTSTALNQYDVHFTTLNIINDMVEYYCDKLNKSLDNEDLSTDFNSQKIIESYYVNVVEEIGVSPKNLIQMFFELSFFKEWEETLLKENIQIVKQPADTKVTKEQKEQIRNLRHKNLLAQVVGQKALFNAIVEALPKLGETPARKLNEVFHRVEILLKLNIMKRNNDLWKGILVGEDRIGTMITKKQNVDFATNILETLLTYDKYNDKELKAKIENINKLLTEKLGVLNKVSKLNDILDEIDFNPTQKTPV